MSWHRDEYDAGIRSLSTLLAWSGVIAALAVLVAVLVVIVAGAPR